MSCTLMIREMSPEPENWAGVTIKPRLQSNSFQSRNHSTETWPFPSMSALLVSHLSRFVCLMVCLKRTFSHTNPQIPIILYFFLKLLLAKMMNLLYNQIVANTKNWNPFAFMSCLCFSHTQQPAAAAH